MTKPNAYNLQIGIAMSTPILLVIVGKNEPLYEAEIDTTSGASVGNDLSTRQNYFVLHSSLDLLDKTSWTTNNMYLKVVDKVRIDEVEGVVTESFCHLFRSYVALKFNATCLSIHIRR